VAPWPKGIGDLDLGPVGMKCDEVLPETTSAAWAMTIGGGRAMRSRLSLTSAVSGAPFRGPPRVQISKTEAVGSPRVRHWLCWGGGGLLRRCGNEWVKNLGFGVLFHDNWASGV
jgi:hypothetical protein